MLGFAAVAAPEKRQGSLITKEDGTIVGSRLLAQKFTRPEYFWPRPSACDYNASATAGSNWSPTNPLLRDRAARQLGPIVTYAAGDKKGQAVGPDVEGWFQQQPPDFVGEWAKEHANIAEKWLKDHADAAAFWLGKSVEEVNANAGETSQALFAQFAQKHPGEWPSEEEVTISEGKTQKQIKPVREGADIQAYFFDAWLQAHPGVELQEVPADAVAASGGGMDPHISLSGAMLQVPRVASARSMSEDALKEIVHEHTDGPTLAAFGGEPIVNVLELNVALDQAAKQSGTTK
jgi:K+-transporting ATPase ATPase C chain